MQATNHHALCSQQPSPGPHPSASTWLLEIKGVAQASPRPGAKDDVRTWLSTWAVHCPALGKTKFEVAEFQKAPARHWVRTEPITFHPHHNLSQIREQPQGSNSHHPLVTQKQNNHAGSRGQKILAGFKTARKPENDAMRGEGPVS